MNTYLKATDDNICKIALHHKTIKNLQSKGLLANLKIVTGLRLCDKLSAKQVRLLENNQLGYL